ncbi:MAG TPA: hypothetical protein VHM02_04965 [Thermoanaerobaculia bacterium]|nr:hypothetical protein [Thermoanaerobaculia bacterium]
MSSPVERSPALWNRSRLDLRSEETLAQLLDRGAVDDWRELYRLARRDAELRARLGRIVSRVPLGYPHFWRAALASLGEPVDFERATCRRSGPT